MNKYTVEEIAAIQKELRNLINKDLPSSVDEYIMS